MRREPVTIVLPANRFAGANTDDRPCTWPCRWFGWSFSGLARGVALADLPGPAARRDDEMRLTLTGTVRMADGSPEPGATVQSTGDSDGPAIVSLGRSHGPIRTSRACSETAPNCMPVRRTETSRRPGSFRRPPSARSRGPDRADPAPAISARSSSVRRVAPWRVQLVVAKGHAFRVQGLTGPDGKVQFLLPAQEPLRELVAWHRELGVQGARTWALERLGTGPSSR